MPHYKLAIIMSALIIVLLAALSQRPGILVTSILICGIALVVGGVVTLEYLIFAWRYGARNFAPAIGLVTPLNLLNGVQRWILTTRPARE